MAQSSQLSTMPLTLCNGMCPLMQAVMLFDLQISLGVLLIHGYKDLSWTLTKLSGLSSFM